MIPERCGRVRIRFEAGWRVRELISAAVLGKGLKGRHKMGNMKFRALLLLACFSVSPCLAIQPEQLPATGWEGSQFRRADRADLDRAGWKKVTVEADFPERSTSTETSPLDTETAPRPASCAYRNFNVEFLFLHLLFAEKFYAHACPLPVCAGSRCSGPLLGPSSASHGL